MDEKNMHNLFLKAELTSITTSLPAQNKTALAENDQKAG
jgi:hypothetical protein